jgi:hypothetical protein
MIKLVCRRQSAMSFLVACLALLIMMVSAAQASGGSGEYDLDWPVRGERLAYHSCGCADDCWVAELRRGRAVRARLRCDCEKLHFWRPGGGGEQLVGADCSATNHADKPTAIRQHLQRLLVAGRAGIKK